MSQPDSLSSSSSSTVKKLTTVQSTTGTSTTPLRIAKTRRDTVQTQLARRQSSSYNHVRNNNLVTNSPFKRFTRIPTPRKASGEKPGGEPVGNGGNVENEDPTAKEIAIRRKQSRSFREVQKGQPVSKSPFLNKILPATPSRLVSTPPKPPRVPDTDASPRSSLVSKRLRGPRSAGSSPTSTPGRRNRRKTVTFDERCDVVEFEAESEQSQEVEQHDLDASNDLSEHDVDDPNALIDFILQDTLMNVNPDDSLVSLNSSIPSLSTPPLSPQQYISPNQEDGVPHGRSHHAERQREAREQALQHLGDEELLAEDSEENDCGLDSARAYHMAHKHALRQQNTSLEADVDQLPGSPSPARPLQESMYREGPIPKLDLPVPEGHTNSYFDVEDDPFLAKIGLKSPGPSSPSKTDKEISDEGHGNDVEDSPLLHARELEQADGKITPASTGSDSSSHDHDHEEDGSFVSAHSDTADAPISPPHAYSPAPARSPAPTAKRLPDPPSPSPPNKKQRQLSEESLRPPAPRLERPSSVCSLDFIGQPGVEIGEMKSALDRLVIDAREMTKDSIPATDLPNHSITSEGKEAERRFSQGAFDESIVTETDGDEEEDDTREMIFPTPPPIRATSSYRLSRSLEVHNPSDLRQSHTPRVAEAEEGEMAEEEEDDATEDEEERAPTPVPITKKDLLSPQIPELRRFSFETGLGFGTTLDVGEDLTAATPAPSATPFTPHRAGLTARPTTPKSPGSARAEREAAIAQRRRELREAEADIARKIQLENEEREREREVKWQEQQQRVKKGEGRKSARRSMSTGDADGLVLHDGLPGKSELFGLAIAEDDESTLNGQSNDRPIASKKEGFKDRRYQLREKGGMIYASSDDKVSHLGSVGDLDLGRAWKTVRRPSDMNEYSRQIKELRSQDKSGKAYAKVFVKVLGVRLTNVPLPSTTSTMTCTLNNGIHFVTTPECKLEKETKIGQEFELIEHSKLEFTVTLKARRDPHILALMRNAAAVSAQPRPREPSPPPKRRLGFFGSPKKAKTVPPPRPATPPTGPLPETFGRYLQNDGAFGRTFVCFKDIASRCDTTLLETSFPIISQKSGLTGEKAVTIGEMILHVFRLPPLPGVPLEQLPQSLEESIRGLRHINWHKVTYHEGTLTQLGGDCSTWRRRRFRVIGAKLVAFNDVTKKAIATIDLRKAIGVEDDQDNGNQKARVQHSDEFDALYGVERSFKLLFSKEENISFFADNDLEKAKWLEVLRTLVGRIPPNPLWAELLWQKQEEEAARRRHEQAADPLASPPPPPISKQG